MTVSRSTLRRACSSSSFPLTSSPSTFFLLFTLLLLLLPLTFSHAHPLHANRHRVQQQSDIRSKHSMSPLSHLTASFPSIPHATPLSVYTPDNCDFIPVNISIDQSDWLHRDGIGSITVLHFIAGTTAALAGTTDGGIFRTSNINVPSPIWYPVADQAWCLSISAIAGSVDDPNVIVAGCGQKSSYYTTFGSDWYTLSHSPHLQSLIK